MEKSSEKDGEKESAIELTNKSESAQENGKNGEKSESKNDKKITINDRIKMIHNYFTIEPYLISYILPMMILVIAIQPFNMQKACRSDLNYSVEICDAILGENSTENETITNILIESTTLTANIASWRDPLIKLLPAFLMLNIGAWSDRTRNRKALMLIPVIGDFLLSIAFLLSTYFFTEWSLMVTGMIEALCSGLTGGLSVALYGSFSYLADVTPPETRTFKMGFVAVIVTLGISAGTALGGFIVDKFGYFGTFGTGTCLYFFAICYTYFRVHDVNPVKEEGSFGKRCMDFIHYRNFWETFSLLALSRGKCLAQILLIIWAYVNIIGPVAGSATPIYHYTLTQYHMDVVEYGLFNTYTTLLGSAGTAIAVTLFSKKLKFHDSLLGFIATASRVAAAFVYAFAPNRGWLYTAVVIEMLANSGMTAVKSLGSKIVDANSIAKMYSLLGFMDGVVQIASFPIYNQLWKNTQTTFPGAFFILIAMSTLPNFFIFLALYFIYKKQEQDVVKDPKTKENHAYENDMTSL